MKRATSERGFTLLELLTAIGIAAVVGLAAAPKLSELHARTSWYRR